MVTSNGDHVENNDGHHHVNNDGHTFGLARGSQNLKGSLKFSCWVQQFCIYDLA
jgi:hypothetical protein